MYAVGLKKSIMLVNFSGPIFMHNLLCLHSFLSCFHVFKPALAIEPSEWDDEEEWVNDITWGHYDSESEEWIQL